jgi:hypothetical protein
LFFLEEVRSTIHIIYLKLSLPLLKTLNLVDFSFPPTKYMSIWEKEEEIPIYNLTQPYSIPLELIEKVC